MPVHLVLVTELTSNACAVGVEFRRRFTLRRIRQRADFDRIPRHSDSARVYDRVAVAQLRNFDAFRYGVDDRTGYISLGENGFPFGGATTAQDLLHRGFQCGFVGS